MKNKILSIINAKPGINNIDLVLKVMSAFDIQRFREEEYEKQLTELVSDAEVIEIEYILLNEKNRIKSVFFPRGTTFTLVSPPKKVNNEKEKAS